VIAQLANINQLTENQSTFNTCNSRWSHITCTTEFNTEARLVRAHLDFCTSYGRTTAV